MRFSIITICFNPADELKTAVNSVLSQENINLEYIIIDGGSTDGTVEFIESLNSQISRFVSEQDNGLYDALNKGIRLATGDIIGFVHADDLLAHDSVLAEIAAEFEKTGGSVHLTV
jgi:glycosyltransferase